MSRKTGETETEPLMHSTDTHVRQSTAVKERRALIKRHRHTLTDTTAELRWQGGELPPHHPPGHSHNRGDGNH